MMDVPAALTAAFAPSADLLLHRARRQIDDAMLMEIASADYGHMADEMMTELRPIRDEGIIAAPMHWQLSEVLRLTRWCNPERPNPHPFKPGPTGRSGHQIRLFACAVLLRAEAALPNENIDSSEDSTLAQCLSSARVLGEEMSEATARFLTWWLPHMVSYSEPLLFDLALLILALRLRSGRIPDRVLDDVAEWVLDEDARWQKEIAPRDPSYPKPIAFSLQSGFWQPLAAELRDEAATIRTAAVRDKIELCALLLEPGY
jgi:hypothetical protein